MGALNNLYVSSSFQGLMKLTNSATGLTNSLQTIQAGDGSDSPLQMSLTQLNISGSFTVNNLPITGSTSGTAGTSGTSGTSGSDGSSGTSGTSGSSGSSGTSGVNGSSGTSGTSGINGTSGTSGFNGSSGTSGTSGSSGSSGTSGQNGSSGTSGTSGINGSSGTSGFSGSSGTSGSSGFNGSSGTSGTSGSSGSSGTSGGTGSSGTSGTSGVDGSSGTSGTSGSSGTSGTSGIDGTSGTSGTSGVVDYTGLITTGSLGTNQSISGSLTVTGSIREKGENILIEHKNETIDFNVTSSVGGNILFGNGGRITNQSGSIFISGSNNIIFGVKGQDTPGYTKYINGDNNIGYVPILRSTGSLINNNTSNNLVLNQTTVGAVITQITSSLNPNSQTYSQNLNLNQAQTFLHTSGGLNFQNNIGVGNTLNSFATTSFIPQNIGYTSNLMIGTNTFTYPSGSATFDRNVLVGLNGLIYNNFGSGSAQTVARNLIGGNANTINNNSGSIATGNNVIWGNSNLISLGGNRGMSNTTVLGNTLIVSGSNTGPTDGGATFVGRFNATGSSQENSLENVFVVGTGTGAASRRNALRIDSNNNSNFTGSVNISGSLTLNGVAIGAADRNGLITTGSLGSEQSITGSVTFRGGSPTSNTVIISGSMLIQSGGTINNMNFWQGPGNVGQNIGIGFNTLTNVSGAIGVTAIGASALSNTTTGGNNTAIGVSSMLFNTTGQNNLAVGGNSLLQNVSGSNNVALGTNALSANAASQNLAIGGNALQNNTTGGDNVAIGYQSLTSNTIGLANLAIGGNTLVSNITGSRNVAIGGGALYYTTNDDNMAIGTNALTTNSTGKYNVAIGTDSQYENIDGSSNIAIGNLSDRNRTSGNGNIAIGEQSLWSIGSGSYNIAIGFNAAYNLGNEDKQFFLGHKDFGSLDGDKSGSLMWGQMNDSVSGQTLQVNGNLTINPSSSFYAHGHKQFNAGEFWSNTTQSGSAGVSGSITFDASGSVAGTSLVSGSRLTMTNAGTYNIQFSAQIETSAGADTAYIWFKKNGNNISNSATKVVLANNTAQVMTVNILDEAVTNDYYELGYQFTNGNATILSEAASGNIPAIPSVIATITQAR